LKKSYSRNDEEEQRRKEEEHLGFIIAALKSLAAERKSQESIRLLVAHGRLQELFFLFSSSFM